MLLEADPVRLCQVFANLLNNAAKYTDPGGRDPALGRSARRTNVVIAVRDTGIGIPPELPDEVFEIFTQVDRNVEDGPSGFGIGLTLVRSFVQLHGGSVEARSEGPGMGSELRVRLPIVVSRRGRRPRRVSRPPRRVSGRCASSSSTTTRTLPTGSRRCCGSTATRCDRA